MVEVRKHTNIVIIKLLNASSLSTNFQFLQNVQRGEITNMTPYYVTEIVYLKSCLDIRQENEQWYLIMEFFFKYKGGKEKVCMGHQCVGFCSKASC